MTAVQTFRVPDVVVAAEASVGEGPVFDRRTGRLCWVDIVEGTLHQSDLADGEQTTAGLGTMLGAVAPRERAEGFAVAVADGFGYWTSGQLTIADRVLPEAEFRMNDAKCDSRGRLWAGSTHMKFVPGAGRLHRWDGTSPSIPVRAGFTLPNGLGWDQEDRRMYLIDSMTKTVLRADFDLDEGVVGEFTPLCRVDPGLPDGLAVDADGCIWVAVWGGAEVRRFSGRGELTGIVPVPVSQPASCGFGTDGTLYITTARNGLTPQQLSTQPLAGSVFALSTTTRGVDVRAFAA